MTTDSNGRIRLDVDAHSRKRLYEGFLAAHHGLGLLDREIHQLWLKYLTVVVVRTVVEPKADSQE